MHCERACRQKGQKAMRINYNVSAMISNNALSNSENLLTKSLERLSSGLKINHAKDNPAGLATAKRMNAQLTGLSKAKENANDGISVIETADGAMTEVHEMLQRLNELAVKSSTGTLSDDDRKMIQQEAEQLCSEIDRISDTVEFDTQKLLNGEFDLKAYTTEETMKVSTYSDKVAKGQYELKNVAITLDADGNVDSFQADFAGKFPADVKVDKIQDNQVYLKAGNGFEMTLDLSRAAAEGKTNLGDVDIDATGIGAMRLQIGSNEGQVLEIQIPSVGTRQMGLENLDLSTKEGAEAAIEKISGAISYVSGVRSQIGAYQNRLESTVNSLDITNENMTSAYSRIMDVDMAEEMTSYTTYQILAQAGTSMLAQANERPSQVLQLLQ